MKFGGKIHYDLKYDQNHKIFLVSLKKVQNSPKNGYKTISFKWYKDTDTDTCGHFEMCMNSVGLFVQKL